MKSKSLAFCLLLLTFYIQASGQISSTGDSRKLLKPETAARDRLTLDVGLSPPGYDYQAGWKALPSMRVGFGTYLMKDVMIFGYFDYYSYQLSFGNGNSAPGPASARRSDFAAYAAVHLGEMLVLGTGAYYTTSDPVYWSGPFIATPYSWANGGFSSLRLFYLFGATHDFQILDRIFMPVGIYIRSSYGDNFGPVFLRLGIGVKF